MLQYLLKTQEIQEKNRKLYFDKQLHVEQNVFLKNMEQKERKQTLYNKLFSKYTITLENKKHIETEDEKKKQDILKKMELIDYRVKDNQKKAEIEFLKKREGDRLKLYEKNLSIERKNRLTQYNNMKKEERLNEKNKKFEDLKNQKAKLDQQKAEIAMEILRQKDDLVNKFEKIMAQKTEVSPELIKKVFPDDDELYEKIVNLKQKQIKGEKKIQSKFGFYGTFQKNTSSLTKKYNSISKERSNYNSNNNNKKGNNVNSIIKEEKSGNEDNSITKNNISNNEEKERIKKEKKEIEIKNKIE